MPFALAIESQPSPSTTMWNLLQSAIMPGWMGCGVVIPLVGVAEVVVALVVVGLGAQPVTPVHICSNG